MSSSDELFQLILGRTTTKAVERILAAGYSKPRTITTVEELGEMLWLSTIRAANGYTLEKLSGGWYRGGVNFAYKPNAQWLPATVLWEPAK